MRRGDAVADWQGSNLAEIFPPAKAGSSNRSHTAWRGPELYFVLLIASSGGFFCEERGPLKRRQIFSFVFVALLLGGALSWFAWTGWQTRWAAPQTLPTLIPTAALAIVSPTTAVSPTPTATKAVSLLPPTITPSPSPTLPPTITPSPTVTPTPSPSATPTLTPTATATLTPTVTPLSPLPTLTLTPNQPQSYLDKFRLVAYYGSPTGPGLGILGNQSRPAMLRSLRQRVADYQTLAPERPILATYHMVVSVAKPDPPYYYAGVDVALVEEWVNAAEAEGVAVILDIQPGQGDVFYIYQRFRHLLYRSHVHLAIDPEFAMGPDQIPGQTVGSLYAATINQVQADLNQIATEIGLNRVLILHQFAEVMLPDKENITDYPHVELIIDGDGVGSPAAKIRNYNQYAQEPAFEYGGFKLFPTDGDYPVMAPGEVMSVLEPAPVLIIYQ